jgi:hypothetical protein
MCVQVLLSYVVRYADNTVILCRKFGRSIVTMAGLTTSVAKNAVTLYENGTELSGNGCPNLGITCTRLLVSLLVLTMHRMMQTPRMTTTATTMMVMRTTSSYRCRPGGKFSPSSCRITINSPASVCGLFPQDSRATSGENEGYWCVRHIVTATVVDCASTRTT